jgi:hypothetical protein
MYHYVITRYERGLSRVLFQGGYGISPILKPVDLFEANKAFARILKFIVIYGLLTR